MNNSEYHLRPKEDKMTTLENEKETTLKPIEEIAAKLGIDAECLEKYGPYKAKIDPHAVKREGRQRGKLIMVTAMTPTPAGEGKTTTTIGLADAFEQVGQEGHRRLAGAFLGSCLRDERRGHRGRICAGDASR